jgi:hypothetical protein
MTVRKSQITGMNVHTGLVTVDPKKAYVGGSMLLIYLVFVLSYYVYLRSEFRVVMYVTISALNDVRFVFTSSCL